MKSIKNASIKGIECMDWEIKVLLLIAGFVIIIYIYFDHRKKKTLKMTSKHPLSSSPKKTVISGGFDSDGIGEIRKKPSSSEQKRQPTPSQNELKKTLLHPSSNIICTQDSFDAENNKNASSKTIQPKAHDHKEKDSFSVFSLILQSKDVDAYDGESLMNAFTTYGLVYGEMNIFHYFDDSQRMMFSIANAFEPGTFPLEMQTDFKTSGIALFTTLDVKKDVLKDYKMMLKMIKHLKKILGGQIFDKNHQLYTLERERHELKTILTLSRNI
jgi:cell division protein ZipA